MWEAVIMKRGKTFISLCLAMLLAVFFSVGLVGCNSSGANGDTTTTSTLDQGYVIGFSNFGTGNSWRIQMEAEFKARADQLVSQGVISQYYMTNSHGDVDQQIADMKDLIAKGCDAIIITAASPDALSPVCEEAMADGIVVISFDNYVTTDDVTAKVGIDEVEFGRVGAQWLVDQLDGSGNIVLLNGTEGTSVDSMRYEGAMSVFSKYPDIKILDQVYADWDYDKALPAVAEFLNEYPEIDGVWSQGGAMTQAALDAFVTAGRPLVPMSGEANNGLLKAWKLNLDNGFDSIAPCSPTSMSADALDTAIKALDGKIVDLHTIISLPVITRDTLDDYVRMDLPDSFWNYTNLSSDQIDALYQQSTNQGS